MRSEIRNYPDKYRLCRLWGHPWEPTTVTSERGVFIQELQCARCPKRRKVVISRRNGETQANRYTNPPDYKISGGITSKERNQLRLLEVKSYSFR